MDNQATIYINRGEGHFIPSHRKENHFNNEYMAICPNTGQKIVTLKTYRTNARNYAAVWFGGEINGAYHSNQGTGFAGGYGYCRESAAAGSAIQSAHVSLWNDIDGRGTDCIRGAVLAIAAAYGRDDALFVKANG
jgi:hypothetical protein